MYFSGLTLISTSFVSIQTNELYQLAAVAFCLLSAWVSVKYNNHFLLKQLTKCIVELGFCILLNINLSLNSEVVGIVLDAHLLLRSSKANGI